jgi:hypothetical protein
MKRKEENMMKRTLLGLILLLPSLYVMTACDTSLSVGSKTIGIRSGEFIFTDGYLRTLYNFPLDQVWSACEKTLTDLKAIEVEPVRKISTGNITAFILDDKVRITVEYVERNLTAVSIMTGPSGNNLASQLLHDRIGNLLKKQ